MDLDELTRKLIDIPSVTGEETAVGEFLESHLEGLGYLVHRQHVTADRFNVFATTNVSPEIVLSTHMDTVPPFIPWRDDEHNIYGRGACDAKGIIAAQIQAAEQLRREGIHEFGLLFTVDEETGSDGAKVANADPVAADVKYLINGEPTDNKLACATKGSLRLTLRTKGVTAHSAYPERGDSAIEKLLVVLADIRKCDWPADERLGETTCNIGVIRGGTRANVVPDEASAELQLRLVSQAAPIKAMIEAAVDGRATIEYLSAHEPVYLQTVAGIEQCVVRFTTDIPYLSGWGKPLLLGPGSILDAHTAEERVGKQELADAVELYVSLVRELLHQDTNAARSLEEATK